MVDSMVNVEYGKVKLLLTIHFKVIEQLFLLLGMRTENQLMFFLQNILLSFYPIER